MCKMKKKWKVILCIALAAVVVGGSLTAWLLYSPPDTDPDAPFEDLSGWTKRDILKAVEKKLAYILSRAYWHADPAAGNKYGDCDTVVCYYGTFNGYHIVATFYYAALSAVGGDSERIGEHEFVHYRAFELFAYKDGVVVDLSDVYEEGLLSDEQMGQIQQCFARYNEEVYTRV